MILAPVGGAIGITKEQWEAVNDVGEYPVLLEKHHGTGKYLASLDVFHQLHCVVRPATAPKTRYDDTLTCTRLFRISFARAFIESTTTSTKAPLQVLQSQWSRAIWNIASKHYAKLSCAMEISHSWLTTGWRVGRCRIRTLTQFIPARNGIHWSNGTWNMMSLLNGLMEVGRKCWVRQSNRKGLKVWKHPLRAQQHGEAVNDSIF